ncbi:MAG: NAD(+) diphosphatase [Rhodospirillaceae bacterium]
MPLTFTQSPIDRAEHLRGKEAEVSALANSARARVLPVWKDLHPVDAALKPLHFGPDILARLSGDTIFLGLAEETPWFALALGGAEPPDLGIACSFAGLRDFATILAAQEASLAVYARAMAIWHLNHPFCSRCGARTRPTEAGHSRSCVDARCGHRTFPRSDPAVIMLISHGDKCLLGRKAEWRPGQYSTIAGFVEPGEDIENAVRREVAEETGVKVGAVRYMASQPWPFPSSLMLGFRGEALSTDIQRDSRELEDCRWFTREEVRAAESGPGTLLLPHRSSISRWLIEGWRDEG